MLGQLSGSMEALKNVLSQFDKNLSSMAKDPKILEQMRKPENIKKVEELAKIKEQLFKMTADGSNNK